MSPDERGQISPKMPRGCTTSPLDRHPAFPATRGEIPARGPRGTRVRCVVTDLARAAGRLVAVPLGAVARRRHGRPMHPRGAVFDAVLDRTGSLPPWGVPWLDEPAREDVVVRLSRGAGLPAPLPDLLGLAVRVPGDDDPVDLLLTSAGRGG